MRVLKVQFFDTTRKELVEDYYRAPSNMNDEDALEMLRDVLYPWEPKIIH